MDANYSDPLSSAFTAKHEGASFVDARPKSLLKKLLANFDLCGPGSPGQCKNNGGWKW
ncbi:hypothetical protein [Pseudomonas sp. Gutcm_11s]|uniref:hypothetical protein n=1 Tax=Pseudomonas sp. Gutcm_11s TaxID=3026088 RepID=UPI00235F15DC|nr:hypothetical protein [Pseudomonas sp. Gutcm_11s]MDD0841421.1 hypothetical protein [Pseudomonas sp. Gutcm_11s]